MSRVKELEKDLTRLEQAWAAVGKKSETSDTSETEERVCQGTSFMMCNDEHAVADNAGSIAEPKADRLEVTWVDNLPGWAPDSKVAEEEEGVRLRASSRDSEETPMEWVLDSGSTMHCCSDLQVFVELNPVQNSYIHTLGTDVRVRGVGTAVLRVESSGKQVRLHNVLYVLGAPRWCAIISMGQLQSQRAVTQGAGDYMTMTLEDGTQIVGRRKTTAGLAEAPSSHLLFHVRGAALSTIEMMGARV